MIIQCPPFWMFRPHPFQANNLYNEIKLNITITIIIIYIIVMIIMIIITIIMIKLMIITWYIS